MPYEFLLMHLPRNIVVQPAIGMFYVYWNRKIVFIARKTAKNPQHNGLWIATEQQYHESLTKEIPAIGHFVFDEGEDVSSQWLLLSERHDDFESSAIAVAELITHRDPRIGRSTPKSRLL